MAFINLGAVLSSLYVITRTTPPWELLKESIEKPVVPGEAITPAKSSGLHVGYTTPDSAHANTVEYHRQNPWRRR
jgi:hypothetical protein